MLPVAYNAAFSHPQAPIQFSDLHLGMADDVVTVAVANERSFTDTSDLAFAWRLLADGVPLGDAASPSGADADGWAPLQLEPVAPQVSYDRGKSRLGASMRRPVESCLSSAVDGPTLVTRQGIQLVCGQLRVATAIANV